MKVYLSLDANNRVQSWGSTRGSENEIEVEVDKDHEFFSKPFIFKHSNGVLTKDESYQQELANRPKPKTDMEIIGGEIVKLKLEIAKIKGGVL